MQSLKAVSSPQHIASPSISCLRTPSLQYKTGQGQMHYSIPIHLVLRNVQGDGKLEAPVAADNPVGNSAEDNDK